MAATLYYSLLIQIVLQGKVARGEGGFVVSLRDVKSRILISLYLGCSGRHQSLVLAVTVSFRVALDNIIKNAVSVK